MNRNAGKLPPEIADWIIQAADEVIAGKLDDQFLFVWVDRVGHPVQHEGQ